MIRGIKRKNRGVTLIALIITIIVLLILAGVSISMVAGDNGILSQAANASDVTDIAKTREEIEMALVGKYDEKGRYTKQNVIDSAYEVTGNDVDMDTKIVLTQKGNEVDLSDLFEGAYVEADTTAPTFDIGTDISSNNLTVTVTAEDEGGIQSYTYYLDGTSENEEVTDATTSSYTFYGLSEGSHTVKIIVKDTSDNGTEKEVSVVIDTTGPSVAITPTTSCDSSWDLANIKLSVSASDDNGIASYEYYLDGSPEKTNTTSSTSNSYTYSGLDLGTTYTVKVVVKDTLGNENEKEIDVDTPGVIAFTINSVSYQAVEGMDWYDWMGCSSWEGTTFARLYGYSLNSYSGLIYSGSGYDCLEADGTNSASDVQAMFAVISSFNVELCEYWSNPIQDCEYRLEAWFYYDGVDTSQYDDYLGVWCYGCYVYWYQNVIYIYN